MISISVENKPLYIPADTSIFFEQNNNLLGDDGICGDIVWSFEIPAEINQRVLGTVQYVASCGSRRYQCEIVVDGIPISTGQLYVQSTKDEKRLTCGIVANAFGLGFGNKKLKENDYGADVVISQTEDNHQAGWRQFLLNTLQGNSIYKFFLFYDSKFYKNNDDYGYHKDKISPLVENNSDKLAGGYVNRLFYNITLARNAAGRPTGVVSGLIEDGATDSRGCRIFNVRTIRGKQNGYCFAPALRLNWLVQKVIENASLAPSGTFFDSADINRLFAQSMCAMDGDSTQYGGRNSLTITKTQHQPSLGAGTQRFVCDEDGEIYDTFKHYGIHKFNFSLHLDQSTLNTNQPYIEEEDFERYDEIFAIAVMPKGGGTLPTWRMKFRVYGDSGDNYDPFIYGHLKSISELKTSMGLDGDDTISSVYEVSNGCAKFNYTHQGLIFSWNKKSNTVPLNKADSVLVQLTPSPGKTKNYLSEGYLRGEIKIPSPNTDVCWHNGNWGDSLAYGREYNVRLVKCRVATSDDTIHIRWRDDWSRMNVHLNSYGQMERLYEYETLDNLDIVKTDPTLNIFSKVLEWKKHVPNLTNGEFLGAVCKAFGLSLFANPMTRQLQLNFFTDTLKGTFFDISEWTTSKERLEYAPKKYEVHFSPILGGSEVSADSILDPIGTKNDTPSALMNLGKHVFVNNEAAYRGSEVDEEKNKFTWPQDSGDNRKLVAGKTTAEEVEDVELNINTPNMTDPDEFSEVSVPAKHICQVETEGCSPMLDKEYTGEFPFILMQDHGEGLLTGGVSGVRYCAANPTCLKADGHSAANTMSLSAFGDNSIGEKWLRVVYDLLGNCDRYRLVAHLPSWAFFKVMATLQPQAVTPEQQVRYIQCDGLRIIPVKISSELSSRESVVCTIEGVCRHVEL